MATMPRQIGNTAHIVAIADLAAYLTSGESAFAVAVTAFAGVKATVADGSDIVLAMLVDLILLYGMFEAAIDYRGQ